MDKDKNKAGSIARIIRSLAVELLNIWLRLYPLSSANKLGVGNIWRAFDKIKMDLLNLRLEAERGGKE